LTGEIPFDQQAYVQYILLSTLLYRLAFLLVSWPSFTQGLFLLSGSGINDGSRPLAIPVSGGDSLGQTQCSPLALPKQGKPLTTGKL